ncbi:AAA family ATPase [Mycobacterium ulcerans]
MGPQARRLVVAAPFAGEGTTTTALNLSLSLAELGEDVLLVEGDTRRPVIAGLLKVESREGLANALANPEIAVEVVKPTRISKLFILASRSVRRETASANAYLPEVIDSVLMDLSARFSRLVIDGPPVLATADTGLLAGPCKPRCWWCARDAPPSMKSTTRCRRCARPGRTSSAPY